MIQLLRRLWCSIVGHRRVADGWAHARMENWHVTYFYCRRCGLEWNEHIDLN